MGMPGGGGEGTAGEGGDVTKEEEMDRKEEERLAKMRWFRWKRRRLKWRRV